MMHLIETLFIALAVYPYSVELSSSKRLPDQVDEPKISAKSSSPKRFPGQVHEPNSPPSTSYTKYSSPHSSPPRRQYGKAPYEPTTKSGRVPLDKAIQALKNIGVTETLPIPRNLFYHENGKFHRVTTREGLVERNEYIIGKLTKNNIIGPVANANGVAVIHHKFDHKQYEISTKEAEAFGIMGELPPNRREVYEVPPDDMKAVNEALKKS